MSRIRIPSLTSTEEMYKKLNNNICSFSRFQNKQNNHISLGKKNMRVIRSWSQRSDNEASVKDKGD